MNKYFPHKFHHHFHDNSGFTLVESMVVMVIGVMVLSAAAAGINKLMLTSEINEEVNNIYQIESNFKQLQYSGDLYSLSEKKGTLYKLGVYPKNMKYDSKKEFVVNRWGGAVSVSQFGIIYNNVPADVCPELVYRVIRSGFFNYVSLGGLTLYYHQDNDVDAKTTYAETAELCRRYGQQDDKEIGFIHDAKYAIPH